MSSPIEFASDVSKLIAHANDSHLSQDQLVPPFPADFMELMMRSAEAKTAATVLAALYVYIILPALFAAVDARAGGNKGLYLNVAKDIASLAIIYSFASHLPSEFHTAAVLLYLLAPLSVAASGLVYTLLLHEFSGVDEVGS